MTYLLDVNALLAIAHAAHAHHGRMEAWVRSLSRRLATLDEAIPDATCIP